MFCFLYRFYCFSTNTGKDYLFYCRQKMPKYKSLYPGTTQQMDMLKDKLTERAETLPVLNWYLDNAHQLMLKEGRKEESSSVESDIDTMQKYWAEYHGAQDTIVMCLEI